MHQGQDEEQAGCSEESSGMIGKPVEDLRDFPLPKTGRDVIPVKKLCPCGCGRYLPEPVRTLHMGVPGKAIEDWLTEQGLNLEDVRRRDNHLEMVEARRCIAKFLSEHGWTQQRIGRFIERDRTTVRHLLGMK